MQVMTEHKVVPKLRFGNFDGEWEVKPINDVCKLKAGKFVSASKISKEQESGLFSCYGGNGLRGFTRTYTHEGSYSLIGRQGALCGNVKFVSGKFHATEHAIVVTPTNINNPHWLYYQLDRLNLNRYATGQAQPGLSVNVIEKVKSSFPSLSEQQKIASFLSAVDTKLQQLIKKAALLEAYKKGVMQKIFSQALRFKDDNGNNYADWEEKKIEDIVREIKNKTTVSNQYPILSSSKRGLQLQEDYFTKQTASINNTGYKILIKGDFTYRSMSDTGSFTFNQQNIIDIGIVSPAYPVFRCKKSIMDTFLHFYLNNNLIVKRQILTLKEGGTRYAMGFSKFKNLRIELPSLDEQKKIANFLSAIDKKIDLVNTQIENTKAFKKGLLQQMFV